MLRAASSPFPAASQTDRHLLSKRGFLCCLASSCHATNITIETIHTHTAWPTHHAEPRTSRFPSCTSVDGLVRLGNNQLSSCPYYSSIENLAFITTLISESELQAIVAHCSGRLLSFVTSFGLTDTVLSIWPTNYPPVLWSCAGMSLQVSCQICEKHWKYTKEQWFVSILASKVIMKLSPRVIPKLYFRVWIIRRIA